MHPLAWWGWAIGIAIAVNGTTNPLLLTMMALAMIIVVLLRRTESAWARSVRAYLALAAFVIAMRVFFQIVVGAPTGTTVLITLPEIPLPAWAAGIRLGGPVTAEALIATVYEALQLAVLLLAIGAANALANPRQALRSVPAALYEASVAVVVALSVAPQLIESGQRVRRARRLRGDTARGLAALGTIALSILGDAIDRSLSLAEGMEARGFARTAGRPVAGTLSVMLVSVLASTMGGFLLLSTDYRWTAAALLVGGVIGVGVGLRRAGARLAVTRYRPDPWRLTEWLVLSSGVLIAIIVLGIAGLDPAELSPQVNAVLQPAALQPSTDPLEWPQLSIPMLLVIALTLAPVPLTRPRQQRIPQATRRDLRTRSPRPETELPETELVAR
ncbi:MAG: energy-coupling factor transporter transmembrane protein EcfT [Propionicimonas sp.]